MTTHDALEWPEDSLWVRLETGELTCLDRGRLREFYKGAAAKTPIEELLAANPEWLGIWLLYCYGEYMIEIPERGPFFEWDKSWLAQWEGVEDDDEQQVAPRKRAPGDLIWARNDADINVYAPGINVYAPGIASHGT